jgi:hypothetical protein
MDSEYLPQVHDGTEQCVFKVAYKCITGNAQVSKREMNSESRFHFEPRNRLKVKFNLHLIAGRAHLASSTVSQLNKTLRKVFHFKACSLTLMHKGTSTRTKIKAMTLYHKCTKRF